MIDGKTHHELGLLQYDEAAARGDVPDAEELLVDAALRHGRQEAVMRELARHGHVLTGTSLLEHLERHPVVPPVLIPPRRYNLLDRLGHICTWLLNDTPIPAQPAPVPNLPTGAAAPARLPKGTLRA